MLEPQPIWPFVLGYGLIAAGVLVLLYTFVFVLWKGWDHEA